MFCKLKYEHWNHCVQILFLCWCICEKKTINDIKLVRAVPLMIVGIAHLRVNVGQIRVKD